MGKKEISGKCNLNTRCSSKPCQHSAHRQGNRVVRKTSCQCPHRGTSTDRTAAGKASSSGRTGSLPSLRTAQFQAIVVEGRANAQRRAGRAWVLRSWAAFPELEGHPHARSGVQADAAFHGPGGHLLTQKEPCSLLHRPPPCG